MEKTKKVTRPLIFDFENQDKERPYMMIDINENILTVVALDATEFKNISSFVSPEYQTVDMILVTRFPYLGELKNQFFKIAGSLKGYTRFALIKSHEYNVYIYDHKITISERRDFTISEFQYQDAVQDIRLNVHKY